VRADASMRAALEWLFGRVDAHGAPDPRGRLCTNNIRARSGERAAAYARGITMRAVLCATNELKNRWNDAVRDMLVDDAARLGGRPGRTYEAVNAPGSIGDDNGEKDIAEQALADDAGLFRNADPSVPLETLHLQARCNVAPRAASPHVAPRCAPRLRRRRVTPCCWPRRCAHARAW
jgi:hypothetical protein